MNKWLLLLVVVGLAAAGWMNRQTISGWLGHKTAAEPTPARATPYPAAASQVLAVKMFPALGIQGSPFNIRFVADYNQVMSTNPDFLAQPNWPMALANRVASELGIGASGPVTPKPAPFASALDNRPQKPGSLASPTPPLLPGLTGSDLDAKPRTTRTH